MDHDQIREMDLKWRVMPGIECASELPLNTRSSTREALVPGAIKRLHKWQERN